MTLDAPTLQTVLDFLQDEGCPLCSEHPVADQVDSESSPDPVEAFERSEWDKQDCINRAPPVNETDSASL